jgi:hypothetical protein
MTNDQMDLNGLVGKSADGDFLRDMISFAAQRLMELRRTYCHFSDTRYPLQRMAGEVGARGVTSGNRHSRNSILQQAAPPASRVMPGQKSGRFRLERGRSASPFFSRRNWLVRNWASWPT